MYKHKQWREGDIAQYFPPHIYIRPQPCIIKKVSDSGAVTRIFFHQRRVHRSTLKAIGLEDFAINEKYISQDENRFLQEYVVPRIVDEDEEIL